MCYLSAKDVLSDKLLAWQEPSSLAHAAAILAKISVHKYRTPQPDRELTLRQEPLPPDHPFFRLDNVLLTPHMATANRDADIKKNRAAYDNFQRVIRGETPINVVQSYRAIETGAGVASR